VFYQINKGFYMDLKVAIVASVFVVTHPIVGIAAQPILAVKATVHAISLNYHWRHTKNAQGITLNRLYMNTSTKFTVEDLTRLKHEQKRLDSRDKLFLTLEYMRLLAKCIIPVIGLFWFGASLNNWFSESKGEEKKFWEERESLSSHINQLERELKARNITVLS
jgi:hypothetical protein